jgi:PmbA protein
MVKEFFQMTEKSTSFNITQSRINSVRNKNITRCGCRVYDGRYLGVAGTMGFANEGTWKEAEQNLSYCIPYPYTPEKGVRYRDMSEGQYDPETFLQQAESLLARLRDEFPDFVFSNKISCAESEIGLLNDAGLECFDKDRTYLVSVVVRAAESANIMDTAFGGIYRVFDEEAILREARSQLLVFRNRVELPEGERLLVAISSGTIDKFSEALSGKLLGLGSSIFADKMNTAAFSEDFSLMLDNRALEYSQCFFDAEGVQLPDDRMYLIEKGVIKHGYTDKDTASRYNMPRTGSAIGAYDGVPVLGSGQLVIEPSEKTAEALIGDRLCVLVAIASGGDWTNDGDYATPVQMAYLVEKGRLVGRLPEFGISGNLYEMFGKNYVGVSADKTLLNDHQLMTMMKIERY